jgi:hypothetical protein
MEDDRFQLFTKGHMAIGQESKKEPATPNGYIKHYIIYIMFRNMQITTNGSVLEQEIDGLTQGKKISVKNNHYLL